MYEEWVREVEKGSFVPMVFLVTGGAGPACNRTLKRLATKISEKKGERFDKEMTFIRTKLIRFSFLKSTFIAIKGYRGKTNKELNVPSIRYNLIPHQDSYES